MILSFKSPCPAEWHPSNSHSCFWPTFKFSEAPYGLHWDYPFLSLRLLPPCCLPTSPTLTFNFSSLVFFLSTCISLMFCYTPSAHPIPMALFDWLLQVFQIKHKSKDLVLRSINETEHGVLCFWSWVISFIILF